MAGEQIFRFKQFTVAQERCAMKVGTDSTLLGAWALVAGAEKILDIGCGTGVVALMLAQRNLQAQITGVELDEAAAAQSAENFARSPWASRLTIQQGPVQDFQTALHFDCIVSNPPFYNAEKFISAPEEQRRLARSTESLSHEALLEAVKRLLAPQGIFSIILPIEGEKDFCALAQDRGLYISIVTEVIPREGKAANRVLMSFSNTFTTLQRQSLVIRKAGQAYHDYTDEFTALLKDFLIIF